MEIEAFSFENKGREKNREKLTVEMAIDELKNIEDIGGVELDNNTRKMLKSEGGILSKFEGSTRRIAGVFALASTLAAGASALEKKEAYAGDASSQTRIEFLEKLRQIPPTVIEGGRRSLHVEGRAAAMMIAGYLKDKVDVGAAIQELIDTAPEYADQKLGNADGNLDVKEKIKLQQELTGTDAWKTLLKMKAILR